MKAELQSTVTRGAESWQFFAFVFAPQLPELLPLDFAFRSEDDLVMGKLLL